MRELRDDRHAEGAANAGVDKNQVGIDPPVPISDRTKSKARMHHT